MSSIATHYDRLTCFIEWLLTTTRICGLTVSNFSSASAYIALGLTAGETIGAVFLGACFSAATAVVAARPGQDHALGYVSISSNFCASLETDIYIRR